MNDDELVKTIRAGQIDAYAVLVERYRERIYRLCYHICGNGVDAEDLAHDSFVDAYLKLDQLRNPERFGPWLRAITLNLCRMWYRQNRRVTELTGDEPFYNAGDDDGEAEDYTRLYMGLAHLPAFHRLVLALHYWEGLSYEEVARFLDIPVGTVMSRLHRARRQLKQCIEQNESEETTMIPPTEDFTREVEAEIHLLLSLFHEQPDTRERLSVLLRRTPERLIPLIREAQDTQVLNDLALLLGRLGAPGVETTLTAYFSADTALRANAATVLTRFVKQDHSAGRASTMTRLADRSIYLLVDRLIQFEGAEPAAKTELLIDLLIEANKQERTALLLMNTLLCWPEAALPALMARFWQAPTPEDLFRRADILQMLCRIGTRFAAQLIPWLQSGPNGGDVRKQRLALQGAEAVARTLHCDWLDLDTVPDEQVALDARFRRKWAAPLRQDRDPDLVRQLATAVATVADDDAPRDVEMRERVVRTLGYLRAREWYELVLAAAQNVDAPVLRLTALRALGDLANPRTTDFLIELLQDPDREVRHAALFALRQIGSAKAAAAIGQAAQLPEAEMREAAAYAQYVLLQQQAREAVLAAPTGAGRRRMSEIVRGDARPTLFISLETVLRAVPEVRSYTEDEITRLIAQVCLDYSSTRRYLIEERVFVRERGIYELTESGQAIWRVERFIRDRYLQ